MTVLIAHAFCFLLIGALPKTGIALLGIGAAEQTALSHFSTRIDIPTSYGDALFRLLVWDFGKTLDGATVTSTLETGMWQSFPLMLVSFGMIALSGASALFGLTVGQAFVVRETLRLSTFLPAFLPGFILLAFSASGGGQYLYDDGLLRIVVLGALIGFMPSCLAIVTIQNAYDTELSQPYVQVLRAFGYSTRQVYAGIRKAVLLYILAGWEKLFTMQIAILIFTEAIFSQPGFGNLILLAAQRTDVNLLLAGVVVISIYISLIRLIGGTAYYFLNIRRSGSEAV